MTRRRWRGPGLGRQLAALALLVFSVTLAGGAYATVTVEQLRQRATDDARLDQLARNEILVEALNEALRSDVLTRYVGMDPGDRMVSDLRDLQAIVVRLGDQHNDQLNTLASDEYYFANTAQRLLTGPLPTGT